MFYTSQHPGSCSTPVQRRSRETPGSHQHWIRETYHLLEPLEFRSGTPVMTPLCLFYSACLGGLWQNEKTKIRSLENTLCKSGRCWARGTEHGGGTLHWQRSSRRCFSLHLTTILALGGRIHRWEAISGRFKKATTNEGNKTLTKSTERNLQRISLGYLLHWEVEAALENMFF